MNGGTSPLMWGAGSLQMFVAIPPLIRSHSADGPNKARLHQLQQTSELQHHAAYSDARGAHHVPAGAHHVPAGAHGDDYDGAVYIHN